MESSFTVLEVPTATNPGTILDDHEEVEFDFWLATDPVTGEQLFADEDGNEFETEEDLVEHRARTRMNRHQLRMWGNA